MHVPGLSTRTNRQSLSSVAYSATQAHSWPASTGDSVCGPFLDRCRCRWQRPITPRSPEEIQARHHAAVARARRSEQRRRAA
jgi:hypothetical protein